MKYAPKGRGPLDPLMHWARRQPAEPALAFTVPPTGEHVVRTYSELLRRVLTAAQALSKLPDGVVGIVSGRHAATVEGTLAAIQAGRRFVLIDGAAKGFEDEFIRLKQCSPVAILTPAFDEMSDRLVDRSQAWAEALAAPAMWSLGANPLATVDLLSADMRGCRARPNPYPPEGWEWPVGLVYSRERGEAPGPYVYAAHALYASACAVGKWLGLREKRRVLLSISPSRCAGLVMALSSVLSGGTCFIPHRLGPDGFWETVGRTGMDMARVEPDLVEGLLDRPIRADEVSSSRLQCVILDSGRLPTRTVLSFLETYDVPVIQCYGTASTGGYALGVPLSLSRRDYELAVRDNVAGRELAYCNVRIEPEGQSTNGEGVFSVRGQVVSSGYWDGKGIHFWQTPWLRTTDLGMIRRINHRDYYGVQGRLHEALVLDGRRVWPAEVEYLLLETFEFLEDCVVVARSEQAGRRQLCAVVVLPEDVEGPRRSELLMLVLARIQAGGVDGLTDEARPKIVVALPRGSIPRDAEGKADRVALGRVLSRNLAEGFVAS